MDFVGGSPKLGDFFEASPVATIHSQEFAVHPLPPSVVSLFSTAELAMASRSIICSYPLLPDPLVNIASIVQPSQRDLSENHVRDTCFGRNRLFSPSSLQIACFGSSVVINCRSYFLMASHGQSVVPFIEIFNSGDT